MVSGMGQAREARVSPDAYMDVNDEAFIYNTPAGNVGPVFWATSFLVHQALEFSPVGEIRPSIGQSRPVLHR